VLNVVSWVIYLWVACVAAAAPSFGEGSWGTIAPGETYVITPAGFKNPSGPAEGAGVLVDPFTFRITGDPGGLVEVVLTFPDSFSFEAGSGSIPATRWTYRWGLDGGYDASGLVTGDTITLWLPGTGVTDLSFGATLTVPEAVHVGRYAASIGAAFAGKETTASRTLDVRAYPWAFFPIHFGDIWQYDDGAGGAIEENRMLGDSSGNDGEDFLRTSLFGGILYDVKDYHVRDSAWGAPPYGNLRYKLDADSGESWTLRRDSSGVLRAIVVDVYSALVFGEFPAVIKKIAYVDSATGDELITDYLASDFGLIRQDLGGSPVRVLRGVRIDGVEYGRLVTDRVGKDELGPERFILGQNYPNPFNPTTTISYEVPEQGLVTLKVFTVLGQEIATLVHAIESPGSRSVRFDGTGLPSGVYFYRLQAGSHAGTKMLMIMK
jgi:hypothetical protein